MIKIENVVMPSPEQWEAVIRGMRNSRNSWDKSDSGKEYIENQKTANTADFEFHLGDDDHELMANLCDSGTDHRKFMRMIPVYLDITAPIYWWKEFDTYKVGTVCNSCSTMNCIAEKEFTLDDFSCEHLIKRDESTEIRTSIENGITMLTPCAPMDALAITIAELNFYRKIFLELPNEEKADYWWQLIQLLPSSYNQRRTVMLNYETLCNIYKSRHNHKLDEWRYFCDWIKGLRYSDLITGEKPEESDDPINCLYKFVGLGLEQLVRSNSSRGRHEPVLDLSDFKSGADEMNDCTIRVYITSDSRPEISVGTEYSA